MRRASLLLLFLCFVFIVTQAVAFERPTDDFQAPLTISSSLDDSGTENDWILVDVAELNAQESLRLVRFIEEQGYGFPLWVTERQKLDAKRNGQDYIDITEHPDFGIPSYTPQPQHQQQIYHPPNSTVVSKILPLLSSAEQKRNLEHFTSFYTRFYNSESGRASSRWLYERAVNYTVQYASPKLREAVQLQVVLHPHAFKQESVIIRLHPNNVSPSANITIVGAHCDSINLLNPFERAPGADDDGSGTVTILEAYRSILESGYIPSSPLEFHFYAGEEGGMLGSIDVVHDFVQSGKSVRGMMQFDMTAWVAAGTQEKVAIVMNKVNPRLTEWLKLVIDKYLDIPWFETLYSDRAGSDHQPWTMARYPAAHAIEGLWEDMNRANAHSPNDTIDISSEFSFEHILEFTKLAVAFAVELSDY
ncbi:hypothetical protein GYMLUDRAFT_233434 [Collybiopsis luxurians FD-317 M1]|uniref:Peptide hydrolase n=1 Tax=Collybiopsis luxurians FD-317 M1 TaxID=944289 RepID=A0A0D0C3W3_9AGAR|nr:hypothetical protein GYMLUDRAFT_233434 [Collybiopsis luxurians FD-317 M1]